MSIVYLGDSNTRGTFTGVSETQRWTYLLSLNRGTQEINRGFGGENSSDGLARIAEVIANTPEWCVISYGTNDAFYTTPPYIPVAAYEANFRSMYLQLYAQDIKAVFLTPPASRDATLEPRIAPYLQAMRKLASKYGIPLVDWHAYTAELNASDPSTYTTWFVEPSDPRVHMNQTGQAALASLFDLPQYASLLRPSSPPSNPPTGEAVKVYARINQLNGAYNLDAVGLTNAASVSKTATGRVRVVYANPLSAPICPMIAVGEAGNYVPFPIAWSATYVDVGIRLTNQGTDADASFVVLVP